VSAWSGAGLRELGATIVAASPFGGAADLRQPAPFLERHVAGLLAASEALTRGRPREAALMLTELVATA
jgi:hypothetical protein